MASHSEFGRWLSTPPEGDEVVVSGVSGRFPETSNVFEFRDNLFNKKDMIGGATSVWAIDHPEIPKRKATIPNKNLFDAGYFGLHYRQADVMDPAMRKILEITTEAIVDAGINPSELKGSKTGVFVGTCRSEMKAETLEGITEPQKFAVTGFFRSFMAHRISYYLKLKGPSHAVDTACSSSSNALELAYKAIRTGRCDQAIVAGSNLLEHPRITHQFFRLGVLSDDGKCKVFDEEANGYARADSMVCVVLQKCKDARRAYGQIIYGKVNCDGFKDQGITYPSKKMQEQLIVETLTDSEVSPSEISFVEAHGTGTKVGDPEEAEAIDNAIAKKRRQILLVGAVKCNIGHTEPSSGLCSLVKVIFALDTGFIPPNIHFKKIKTGLTGFEEGRMKVVTEITRLDRDDAIISLNNFGFGGNNTNLLIRRFKKQKVNRGLPSDDLPRLVCVSGRTEEAVRRLLEEFNTRSLDAEYVGLLHQIFKSNFDGHLYRGYAIVDKTGVVQSSVKFCEPKTRNLYAFFGNLENNYQVIGRQLSIFPQFKETIQRIENCLVKQEINVSDVISGNQIDPKYDSFGAFAVEIGIVDLLKVLDLNLTAVYGDSLGKLATAYYYSDVTLEQAVLAAYESATLSEITPMTLRTISYTNSERQTKLINYFLVEKYQKQFSRHGDDFTVNIGENSTIIHFADKPARFSNQDLHLTNNFLQLLGSLYQKGHNFQIHNLYPQIQFPVSRNTPMISHAFRWNYNKKWYTYEFEGYNICDSLQQEYPMSYTIYEDQKYIQGHVIDGRNLIPATEYLFMVWKTFAGREQLLPKYVPVIFENCRFIRAVVMPKTGGDRLLVSIQIGSGEFVVCEKNSVVVTGRIRKLENKQKYFTNLPPLSFDEDDKRQVLEQDEIYRELYIRGYNYSGLFKGIKKSNVDSSVGLVQWEDNWTTFIDKMLQLKILQFDTKSLYVPVGIKKLTIDPQSHLAFAENQKDMVCPVYNYKDSNVVKSGGIEIAGLQATAISKRRTRFEPVLEKYVFVPNILAANTDESVRINIQIILENSLENNLKVVEIVDQFTKPESVFLSPLVQEAASDLPLVAPDLTISSQSAMEDVPNIKSANFVFTPTSNLTLIIGTQLLQRSVYLKQILNSLKPNGYIMTREDKDLIPENLENLQVLTEHSTNSEKLILLQRSNKPSTITFVEISSSQFDWLQDVQQLIKNEPGVVIYSKNRSDGVIGLVNCLRREPGSGKIRCFFMMDDAPKFDPEIPFYKEQIEKNLAINIYKDSIWGTYRHMLLDPIKEIESKYCYVNVTSRGDLSSLKWLEGPLTDNTAIDKNKNLIYPYYSAVNFKDVVIASGHVNIDAFTTNRIMQDKLLGLEIAGMNNNGRRVMGMTDCAGLATVAMTDDIFLWDVPVGWSLEDAASSIVVHATVIYGLLWTTTIKRGTSILIHSGTGGIGLAALNVCLYHGCDIYVTVGTQEKREYLRKHYPQIPECHIGNSRDTSFEEMVKTGTKGRGVDIVLNSLSGDKLRASIRCMASGGDFIEIGKYDLGNDAALNLLLFEKHISYHGVMLDRVVKNGSEKKAFIVDQVSKGIAAGYIKPLPRTVFGKNEVEKAFRYMTTGKHIGKVLVKIRDEEQDFENDSHTAIPRFNCQCDKSYIIIGGLGGFGLELADWLYLRGVKNLILVSRYGLQSGYQTQKIRNWESADVTIKISTKDVTTKQGCLDVIQEATQLGPIDGIFNLAVVLKDALFEDQTPDNFSMSLAPKATATTYLDEVTRQHCPNLSYFVVFSSVSCGRGNVGQTNYGMANSVMERVCEKRKSDGLPGLAIQWGAIGDVGLVAKMQKENKELVIGGTLQQRISNCLEVLDILLKQDNPVVSSMVVAEKNKDFNTESAVAVVAHILGIKDLKMINPQTTLAELGMDSMTGTEIVQILEKNFEIFLTPKEVRSMTFARLIEMEQEKQGSGEKTVGGAVFIQCIPTRDKCSVPVKQMSNSADGETKTVFILPGVEGVLQYLEFLATNLKAKVLGIQYNYDDPEDCIQETAKNLLPYIEANMEDNKLFTIISHSFGSDVGLEIASLLEEKGYEGTLIIIDSSPSYLSSTVRQNFPVENDAEFQSLLMYKILCLFLPTENLEQHKEKLFSCKNLTECMDLSQTLIPQEVIEEKQLERQAVVVLYNRFKSMLNYKFDRPKLRSKVYLIKAKCPMVADAGHDYHLSNLCEKPLDIFTVDGDHSSILKQAELVDIVTKLI